jgi:hypothetical protein
MTFVSITPFLLPLLSLLPAAKAAPSIHVSLPSSWERGRELGRVRVYLSTRCSDADPPPRAQCSDDQDTAQVFGVNTDVGGMPPGGSVVVDASTLGYPVTSLESVPDGTYCAQAELMPYSVWTRGDGHNLTLPLSCVSDGGGDGSYGSPADTLYSDVVTVQTRARSSEVLALTLTHRVEKVASPGCSGHGADTKWIKTVRVRSALLSSFWGRDITLEACVLIPFGWAEHPTARYPLVIAHGHYSAIFEPGGRFDNGPVTPDMHGYDRFDQRYAQVRSCARSGHVSFVRSIQGVTGHLVRCRPPQYLYRNWTSADGPFKGARALVVTINHPVPFFDDSYAVDSANVGPYGSAIMTELLPAIEKAYRGIGEGWARGVLGGSTGGWEAFAVQVRCHPNPSLPSWSL